MKPGHDTDKGYEFSKTMRSVNGFMVSIIVSSAIASNT